MLAAIFAHLLFQMALDEYPSDTEEAGIFDGEDGLFDDLFTTPSTSSAPSGDFMFRFSLSMKENEENSPGSSTRTMKRPLYNVDTPNINPSPVKKHVASVANPLIPLPALGFLSASSPRASPPMSSPPPASSPPAHTSAQSSIPASSPSPFLEDDMFEHDNSDMPHMANVGSSDNEDDDSDDSDSDDESDDEIDSHVTDAVPEGSGKEVVEGALTGRTSVQPSAPLPTYGSFKFQLTSLWTTVPKEV